MIRKAELKDAEKFIDLFIGGYKLHQENRNDIFPKRSKQELLNILKNDMSNNIFYLYEKDNKIVGFISFHFIERQTKALWIDELFVDKNFRNNGVATELINEMKKIAKENDCSRYEFCCWAFNKEALQFYRNLDFEEQRIIFEKKIK